MKTLKIFATALLLSITSMGFAQDSDVLTASARIIDNVTVTQENDLYFGQFAAGDGSIVLLTDETAGRFRVDAVIGSEVTLTLTGLGDLEDDASNTLEVIWTAGVASNDDYTSNTDEWGDPSIAKVVNATSADPFFVFIGGEITEAASTTAPAGVYEKEITLSVEYN